MPRLEDATFVGHHLILDVGVKWKFREQLRGEKKYLYDYRVEQILAKW